MQGLSSKQARMICLSHQLPVCYLSICACRPTGGATEQPMSAVQSCAGSGKVIVAERTCSVARWESVASRLSLLPGIICPTLTRSGNDRIYFLHSNIT